MIKTACNLDSLPCGQNACIETMTFESELQARLSALGLRHGKWVQVIRRAGLGGPLHVRVGTTDIILRRREAARIQVNPPFALAA
ncbi:MAG: ferrous iron transport protein A [Limnohabitans sp.]